MLGYGAYPLRSAWSGVTSGYFARQVLNFSDVNAAEETSQEKWFFGASAAFLLDAEVGTYGITGEPAELVRSGIAPSDNYISESTSGVSALSNTMESFFVMTNNASAADTITNAKVISVVMSEGAVAADLPGRTWNPINTPQTTTWTLIQTP